MSNREQIVQIIDQLPDYKLSRLLVFLKGMAFDDELEDDLFCERLYQSYLDDPDPDKHKTCLLYTSPSPRDRQKSRMPSSA